MGRRGTRGSGRAWGAAVALAILAACGSGPGGADPGAGPDDATTAGDDAAVATDDRGPGDDATTAGDDVAAGDLFAGDAPASDAPCTILFGLPNERTGLGPDLCRPSCDCEGRRFTPPAYGEADAAALDARVLVDPPAIPAEDPYLHPDQHVAVPGKACAVSPDGSVPGGYRLQTYDGLDAARAAGAVPTHRDACGLCSSLQDLAVYMRQPDLTQPVRQCGIVGMMQGEEPQMECLRDLGFSEPCARIWFWNSRHTQQECQDLCLAQLEDPYHLPDGSLNTCLQCDEVKSGDVFKAVAGRTRRNTGLPSSMCRPCAEVVAVVHVYP